MRTSLILAVLLLSACELTPDADWEFTGASPYEGAFAGSVVERGRRPADADIKLVLKTEVAMTETTQTFKADFELKSDLTMGVGFLCGGTKTIEEQVWELEATVTNDNKVSGSKVLDVDGNEVTAKFNGTFDRDVNKAELDIVFDISNTLCTDPALKGSFTRK